MKYIFTALLIVGGDSFLLPGHRLAPRMVSRKEYRGVRSPKERADCGPATEGRKRMLWLCQAEHRN